MLVSEVISVWWPFLQPAADRVPINFTSRYRCFKMAGLQPFCAALFALGYALREVGAYNYSWQTDIEGKVNTTNLIIYVLSQVFVFVAP